MSSLAAACRRAISAPTTSRSIRPTAVAISLLAKSMRNHNTILAAEPQKLTMVASSSSSSLHRSMTYTTSSSGGRQHSMALSNNQKALIGSAPFARQFPATITTTTTTRMITIHKAYHLRCMATTTTTKTTTAPSPNADADAASTIATTANTRPATADDSTAQQQQATKSSTTTTTTTTTMAGSGGGGGDHNNNMAARVGEAADIARDKLTAGARAAGSAVASGLAKPAQWGANQVSIVMRRAIWSLIKRVLTFAILVVLTIEFLGFLLYPDEARILVDQVSNGHLVAASATLYRVFKKKWF